VRGFCCWSSPPSAFQTSSRPACARGDELQAISLWFSFLVRCISMLYMYTCAFRGSIMANTWLLTKALYSSLFQVVSLGAGKDSLFFRLRDRGVSAAGGYFEVDFPAVSSWKSRLVAKTPALSALADGQSAFALFCAVSSHLVLSWTWSWFGLRGGSSGFDVIWAFAVFCRRRRTFAWQEGLCLLPTGAGWWKLAKGQTAGTDRKEQRREHILSKSTTVGKWSFACLMSWGHVYQLEQNDEAAISLKVILYPPISERSHCSPSLHPQPESWLSLHYGHPR